MGGGGLGRGAVGGNEGLGGGSWGLAADCSIWSTDRAQMVIVEFKSVRESISSSRSFSMGTTSSRFEISMRTNTVVCTNSPCEQSSVALENSDTRRRLRRAAAAAAAASDWLVKFPAVPLMTLVTRVRVAPSGSRSALYCSSRAWTIASPFEVTSIGVVMNSDTSASRSTKAVPGGNKGGGGEGGGTRSAAGGSFVPPPWTTSTTTRVSAARTEVPHRH